MGLKNICQIPDKLRIVYLVTQGIAVILNTVALAIPRWDNFYPELPQFFPVISLHQNLWEIVDESDPIYIKQKGGTILTPDPDEDWKIPIIILMTTGLAVGVLATILLAMTATIKKMMQNNTVCGVLLLTVFVLTTGSASEITYSAIKFKSDHLKILSGQVYDEANQIPYQQYGVDTGYYVCLVSGAWYALSAVVILADLVKFVVIKVVLKDSPKVTPNDNNESPKEENSTKA